MKNRSTAQKNADMRRIEQGGRCIQKHASTVGMSSRPSIRITNTVVQPVLRVTRERKEKVNTSANTAGNQDGQIIQTATGSVLGNAQIKIGCFNISRLNIREQKKQENSEKPHYSAYVLNAEYGFAPHHLDSITVHPSASTNMLSKKVISLMSKIIKRAYLHAKSVEKS